MDQLRFFFFFFFHHVLVIKLRLKHPARSSFNTSHLSSAATLSTLPADDTAIRRYLARKAREQPAAGPSGILAYLTATPNGIKAFRVIATHLMAGTLPPMAREALAASSLFAIPKSLGQVRPIAVGEAISRTVAAISRTVAAISRTVAALLNASITPALTKYFDGIQLGAGVSGGREGLSWYVTSILHPDFRLPNNKRAVVLSLDVANAFNSISRQAVINAAADLEALAPIRGLVLSMYGAPSQLIVREGAAVMDVLTSAEGVRQGGEEDEWEEEEESDSDDDDSDGIEDREEDRREKRARARAREAVMLARAEAVEREARSSVEVC